jgi:HrpA-like RNA helicase
VSSHGDFSPTRKVILATTIAESSLTVPDVRYVIDFGLIKEIYYDAKTNLVCNGCHLEQNT